MPSIRRKNADPIPHYWREIEETTTRIYLESGFMAGRIMVSFQIILDSFIISNYISGTYWSVFMIGRRDFLDILTILLRKTYFTHHPRSFAYTYIHIMYVSTYVCMYYMFRNVCYHRSNKCRFRISITTRPTVFNGIRLCNSRLFQNISFDGHHQKLVFNVLASSFRNRKEEQPLEYVWLRYTLECLTYIICMYICM